MKISEVIERLEEIKDKKGDLELLTFYFDKEAGHNVLARVTGIFEAANGPQHHFYWNKVHPLKEGVLLN